MRPIRVQVLIASLLLASGVHAADEPLFVEGSVRGAALETPADVLVELVPVVSQLESSRLLLAGEPSPPAVATAVPADSGRFRLAVPMIGVYRVRLSAPDHLTMRTLPVPVTGALELPLLTLAAATTLETSIRDADGRPVADAWVVARAAGGAAELWRAQGSPGWLVAPRLARSGPDGRADVPRLAGEPLEIRIRLPGDATPRAFTEVGPRLDVRLEADTVTRRWITLEGAEAGTVVSVGRERWPVGELDVAGRLRLAGPFDDRVALHFLSAERPLQSVWLEPGDEQPVYSVLPAHRFTGRLVDSTGKPLVGALVWPSWDPGNQATTDESGGYAFNYPLSPRFEVRGAAPRLAPRSLALTYVGASRGAVPDLVLYPSSNAAGRIVDAAGRGVAGARVMAVSLEGASRRALAPVHATADRAGHFELRGLTPDSIHRLSAVQDGHFPTDLEVGGIRPGGRREGLRLALVARRGAFGRVVDVEDRPLAGIEVLVRPTGGHTAEPARVRTDPDGRFELGAMPAPKVDLIASGEGYAPLTVPGVEPGLGRGAIDLGTLMLTRGATIAGEVTAASGDPLDGVAVWISPQPVVVERLAWERLSLQPPDAVSADGQFSISGLSLGQRVDLVAYRTGFLPAVVRRVEAPAASPVQVRLRPTARIAGRVLDQDLEPIEGALVALSASAMPEGVSAIPAPIEHDPERATRSGTDGIFEITGLLP
ncbi:MAG: carboxypeptidase-like regulatory domain-containing protein, partial [Acidobacteriota bacterium]